MKGRQALSNKVADLRIPTLPVKRLQKSARSDFSLKNKPRQSLRLLRKTTHAGNSTYFYTNFDLLFTLKSYEVFLTVLCN